MITASSSYQSFGEVSNGGDVTLGSPGSPLHAVMMRGTSAIDASSETAGGGNIEIHANAFAAVPDSELIATGATSNGSVTIDTRAARNASSRVGHRDTARVALAEAESDEAAREWTEALLRSLHLRR